MLLLVITIPFLGCITTRANINIDEIWSLPCGSALQRISAIQNETPEDYADFEPIYSLIQADCELGMFLEDRVQFEGYDTNALGELLGALSKAYGNYRSSSANVKDVMYGANIKYDEKPVQHGAAAYRRLQQYYIETAFSVGDDSFDELQNLIFKLRDAIYLVDINDNDLQQKISRELANTEDSEIQVSIDKAVEKLFRSKFNGMKSSIGKLNTGKRGFFNARDRGDYKALMLRFFEIADMIEPTKTDLEYASTAMARFFEIVSTERFEALENDYEQIVSNYESFLFDYQKIILEKDLFENNRSHNALEQLIQSVVAEDRIVIRRQRETDARRLANLLQKDVETLIERVFDIFDISSLETQDTIYELYERRARIRQIVSESGQTGLGSLAEYMLTYKVIFRPDFTIYPTIRILDNGVTFELSFQVPESNAAEFTTAFVFLNFLALGASNGSVVDFDNLPKWIKDSDGIADIYDALNEQIMSDRPTSQPLVGKVLTSIQNFFQNDNARSAAQFALERGLSGEFIESMAGFKKAFIEERAYYSLEKIQDLSSDEISDLFNQDADFASLVAGYANGSDEDNEVSHFFNQLIVRKSIFAGEGIAVIVGNQTSGKDVDATLRAVHPFSVPAAVNFAAASTLLSAHTQERSVELLLQAHAHLKHALAELSVDTYVGINSAGERLEVLAAIEAPKAEAIRQLYGRIAAEMGLYDEALEIVRVDSDLYPEIVAASILETTLFDRTIPTAAQSSWKQAVDVSFMESLSGGDYAFSIDDSELLRYKDLAFLARAYSQYIEPRNMLSMGENWQSPPHDLVPVAEVAPYVYIRGVANLNRELAIFNAKSIRDPLFQHVYDGEYLPAFKAFVACVHILQKLAAEDRSATRQRQYLEQLSQGTDDKRVKYYLALAYVLTDRSPSVNAEGVFREIETSVGYDITAQFVETARVHFNRYQIAVEKVKESFDQAEMWKIFPKSPARERAVLRLIGSYSK